MSNLFIILLALIDGPITYHNLVKKIEDELREECPWGVPIRTNCFLNDLNEIISGNSYAEINIEHKYSLTKQGINVLINSKLLDFIYKIQYDVIELRCS
ncbi:hypothetical protein KAI92_02640 [Candidatus Parcubacteria bacterium]|nr:hypothetical protein [Candidatus Parcubacteria bacterium]